MYIPLRGTTYVPLITNSRLPAFNLTEELPGGAFIDEAPEDVLGADEIGGLALVAVPQEASTKETPIITENKAEWQRIRP
jgi:hypothetical protein